MTTKRWIGLAAALVLAGCSEVESPVSSSFRATATLSAASFKAGENVTVTVTVTNVGTQPESFQWAQCRAPFIVKDAVGTVVGPNGSICDLALNPWTVLAPGGNYTYKQSWAGTSGYEFLPSGTYALSAQVENGKEIIGSPGVVFKIVP